MSRSEKADKRARAVRGRDRDCVDWVAHRLAPTIRRLFRGIGDALGFEDGIFGMALLPGDADHVYFADFVGSSCKNERAPEGDIPAQKHHLHPGNALSAALYSCKNGVVTLGKQAALNQEKVISDPLVRLFGQEAKIPDPILIHCRRLDKEKELKHCSFVYFVPLRQESNPPVFWQRLGELAPLLAQLIRSHVFVVGAAEARPRNELEGLLACLPAGLPEEEDQLLGILEAVQAEAIRVKRAIQALEIRIGLAKRAGERSTQSARRELSQPETLDLWIAAIERKRGHRVELVRLAISQGCTACGPDGLKLIQAKGQTQSGQVKLDRRGRELAMNQQVLLYMLLRAAAEPGEPMPWDDLCCFLEPGFSRQGVAATAARDAINSRGEGPGEAAAPHRDAGRILEAEDDMADYQRRETSRRPPGLETETMSGIGRAAVRRAQQRTCRRLESANRYAEAQLKKVLDIQKPRRKLTMFKSVRGRYRVVPSVEFDRSFQELVAERDWVVRLIADWTTPRAP